MTSVQQEVSNEVTTQVSSEYLFELKTVQSSAFRVLVEALKEILTDKKGCFLLPIDPLSWKNLFLNIMNKKLMLSEFKSQNIRTFYDFESDFEKIILKKILKNI